jgi:hypothetical protein
VLADLVPAGRALALVELTLAPGILWEGAVVVRRSIRTRAVSGLRAKAQLLAVPEERVGAARAAALV